MTNCFQRLYDKLGRDRLIAGLTGGTVQGVNTLRHERGGRKPTRQHEAHVLALELIIEHGLVEELAARLNLDGGRRARRC